MTQRTNAEWLSDMAGKPVLPPRREELQDLIDSRPFWDSLADFSDLPEDVDVHEDVVLWDRDGRRLEAEIYVPKGPGPYPLHMHFHGGGFCVSTAKNDRKYGMQWASRGFTVINPDYGLSPENPFPAAVEDCLYASRWLVQHQDEYKGDASLGVLIEGGSAGGGLAASVIVALNGLADQLDEGDLAGVDVPLTAAVLFFGIHDFNLLLTEAGSNVGSAELWNRAYLGPHFTTKLRDPIANQVYAPNLDRFPPTYISCGALDSLIGHSLALGKELALASVPVRLSIIEGADHGYAKMAGKVPGAAEELDRIHTWVDQQLADRKEA